MMSATTNDDRFELTAEAADEARRGTSPHAPNERFIPVSKYELIERLTRPEVWPGTEPKRVRALFTFLSHWRHLSYAERQHEILRHYLPFSPDSDTVLTQSLSKAESTEHQKKFIELVRELLERANYDEIPQDQIAEVIAEKNPIGLELAVDLSEFEELHIFYRGMSQTTMTPTRLERIVFRKPSVTLEIYQRLFILLKLKPIETRIREIMMQEQIDAKRAEKIVKRLRKSMPKSVTGDFIYLKLFKFIPRADLEMLLPNTHIKIKRLDKIRLGVTAGGGTTAGIVTTVAKFSTTSALLANPLTSGMALAGLAGIVFRQVANVFHTRTQYMAHMAQNLYFHSLANNHGVLALLAERGEEEDIKEEVLLYTLLAKTPVTRAELPDAKRAIEQYLKDEFKVTLNFDLYDGLERLERDGLVTESANGTLIAKSPAAAADHIDNLWDGYLDQLAARDDVIIHSSVG